MYNFKGVLLRFLMRGIIVRESDDCVLSYTYMTKDFESVMHNTLGSLASYVKGVTIFPNEIIMYDLSYDIIWIKNDIHLTFSLVISISGYTDNLNKITDEVPIAIERKFFESMVLNCGYMKVVDPKLKKQLPIMSIENVTNVELSNCSTISIQENGIQSSLLKNDSHVQLFGAMVHRDFFLMFENGRIEMCQFIYNSLKTVYISKRLKDYIQGVLSFCLTIVSLIALLITFAHHLVFKKLRNLHGKITMNVIANLFIAQFIFQLGAETEFREVPDLCVAIAICSHYFWLSTFAWLLASSYSMFQTFTKGTVGAVAALSFVDSSKGIKNYVLFGYGFPLLIMTATLTLQFCDCSPIEIGYGKVLCILPNPEVVGYFFGIPVALVIVINLVMFCKIVHALRQASPTFVKQSKSDGSRSVLVVSIKLTLLMGFSWTFGFVAALTDLEAFWYLFIIFNCLQGVGIAIVTLSSSRVRRMYHDSSRRRKALSNFYWLRKTIKSRF